MELCSLPPELILRIGNFLPDSSLNALIKSQKLFAGLLTPQLYNHQITSPKPLEEDFFELNTPQPTLTCFDCAGRWHSDVILSYFRSRPIHALTHIYGICGHTLLHIVTKAGNVVLARILISKGLEINAKDFTGRTPLFAAVHSRKEEMMDLLLKAGADPTAVDPNGRTLLEDTAMFGSGTMVQRLVDALKQVQCHGDRSVNSSGISQRRRDRSLQSAIYNGDERAARILLDYGANPSSAGENGTTPLVASADDGCENLINMLLDRGADPLPCDRFGMSATRYAVQSGCSWGVTRKLYQAVLDAGGDITAASPSSGGPTALLSFAERGCLPAVKFILSHKVVTDTQSVATALHLALYNYPSDPVSYEEVCRFLIKEINVVNEEFGHTLHVLEPVAGGGTSLHLAAHTGSDTLVQLLLSSGVDDYVLDNEGRSALDIAKLEGHDGIAKLLSEKENLN